MSRTGGIDDLADHADGRSPQFATEVVTVATVPARTVGRAYNIHTTAGSDGISHFELADSIVYPFLALIWIGSQRVAPHAHLGYREPSLVGSVLIRHDGILAIVTSDGKIHTFQPESLVLGSPLLRRVVLQ